MGLPELRPLRSEEGGESTDLMAMIGSMLQTIRKTQGPDSVTQSLAVMVVSDRDEAELAGRFDQWVSAWKKGEDAAKAQIDERKTREGF